MTTTNIIDRVYDLAIGGLLKGETIGMNMLVLMQSGSEMLLPLIVEESALFQGAQGQCLALLVAGRTFGKYQKNEAIASATLLSTGNIAIDEPSSKDQFKEALIASTVEIDSGVRTYSLRYSEILRSVHGKICTVLSCDEIATGHSDGTLDAFLEGYDCAAMTNDEFQEQCVAYLKAHRQYGGTGWIQR